MSLHNTNQFLWKCGTQNVSKKLLLCVFLCKQCLSYRSEHKNKRHNNAIPTLQAGDGLQLMFEVLFLPDIVKIQQLQVMKRQLSLIVTKTTLFLPTLLLDTRLFFFALENEEGLSEISRILEKINKTPF